MATPAVLELIFSAKTDGAKKAMSELDGSAKQAGQSAGQAGSKMQSALDGVAAKAGIPKSLTASFGALGTTAVVAGTAVAGVALAAKGLYEAVQAAEGFEAAMQEVKSLQIPEVTADFESLRQGVSDLATTMAIDATDAAQATYNALSAGVPAGEVLQFLEASAIGARGGLANLSDSASVVATVMNTFGESAGSSQEIVDVLFGTVKAGVTTFPELASNFGQFANIASSANMTLEESAAALAVLTKSFPSTAQAATGLKALLVELKKPGDDLVESLDGVSLTADGLDAVLGQLESVAHDTGTSIDTLFGSAEAGAAALALSADQGMQFVDTLDAIENSAGSAQAAMDIVNDSFMAQKEILSSQLMGALREVGLYLLDGLTPALTVVNEWIAQYLPAATDILIGALHLIASTFRAVFDVAIAIVRPFWEFWAGFLEGFSIGSENAFQKFMIVVKMAWTILQTFGKVAWAVFKAVSSVIFQVFRGAGKIIGNFFGSMNRVAGGGLADFIRGFRDASKAILKNIGTMAEKGAELVTKFINHILDNLGVLARIPFFKEFLGGIAGAVASGLEGIQSAVSEGTAAIDEAADVAYRSLKELESVTFDIPVEEPTLNMPPDFGSGVASEAAAAGAGAGEAAGRAAGRAASDSAKGATEKMMADLAKAMAEAIKAGIDAIYELVGAELPTVESLMPKIKILEDFFTELGLAIQRAGKALNPDEKDADIKRVAETGGVLKTAIDVFKSAAALVDELAELAAPNLTALDNVASLIQEIGKKFLEIAKLEEISVDGTIELVFWTERQAEGVKRFADALKPVVDILKTAATLDLGKVTAITEEQMSTAMANILMAGEAVFALSAGFRKMATIAQEQLVTSLGLFATAVGTVVETLKAVASLNLHGITKVAEKDLETASTNLLEMARTVWELSKGWRELVADAQVKIVEDITRFAASVKAISDTLGSIASFQIEKITGLTIKAMEILRGNILKAADLVWQISTAFRELSPQTQQELVEAFKRFSSTVAEIAKTLAGILDIPTPSEKEVARTFGWTTPLVESIVYEFRKLERIIERAIDQLRFVENPVLIAFGKAVKDVTGSLKAIVELTEAPPSQSEITRTFGWTTPLVESIIYEFRKLERILERALDGLEFLENETIEAFGAAVDGVVDALKAIAELPMAPEEIGGLFDEGIVELLVGRALELAKRLDFALGLWGPNGELTDKIEAFADLVGGIVDTLKGLIDLPAPPLPEEGDPSTLAGWTWGVVGYFIGEALRISSLIERALVLWDGEVDPKIDALADTIGSTVDVLRGILELTSLDFAGAGPLNSTLIDEMAENIRLVIDRLAAVVGEAEGQVSTDMLEKAKALAEAFAPVQEVLGGIGDTIRALMENPFAKASSRLRGASNSVQFGQAIDGNAFQKRLIDSIQTSITTLLSALAGITIPADLGDRFKPLKDAADAIKAAMETLAGISLPENLDAILAAAQQLIGFGGGSGGGGGAGTDGKTSQRYDLPPEIMQKFWDAVIDIVAPGGGAGTDGKTSQRYDLPPEIMQKLWDAIIRIVVPGGGEGNSDPGYSPSGGSGFSGLHLTAESATIQNASIPNLALALNFTIGAQKFAAASVEGFQVDQASTDKLIQIIDRRRAQNP